jgi:hypothetical protein
VSFGTTPAASFLLGSTKYALVDLPELKPGAYDVVLYDYMQEVARMPKAVTVEPSPPQTSVLVDIGGMLISLTSEQVPKLEPGLKLPDGGPPDTEILAVGAPEPEVMHIKTGDKTTMAVPSETGPLQLPARIRTKCYVLMTTDGALTCTIRNVPLAPDAIVQFVWHGQALNFRVSDVHYPGRSRTAAVHVRFLMSPEVRAKMKASDRDLGALAFPAGQMATLVSVSDRADGGAASVRDARLRQPIPTSRALIVDAVLDVPVEESPLGWLYKNAPVKVGAPMSFETAAYTVDGGVTEVAVKDLAPGKPSVAPASR